MEYTHTHNHTTRGACLGEGGGWGHKRRQHVTLRYNKVLDTRLGILLSLCFSELSFEGVSLANQPLNLNLAVTECHA